MPTQQNIVLQRDQSISTQILPKNKLLKTSDNRIGNKFSSRSVQLLNWLIRGKKKKNRKKTTPAKACEHWTACSQSILQKQIKNSSTKVDCHFVNNSFYRKTSFLVQSRTSKKMGVLIGRGQRKFNSCILPLSSLNLTISTLVSFWPIFLPFY